MRLATRTGKTSRNTCWLRDVDLIIEIGDSGYTEKGNLMNLLTRGNPKTIKGEAKGFLTFILHLAPTDLSGYNTCPKATEGCKKACLNTAGRGGMFKPGGTNAIQEARKRKTRFFFENREAFMEELGKDIIKAINYSRKKNLTPVFRLNGTSDLSWEKYELPIRTKEGLKIIYENVFDAFPNVQFYDYTKVLGRKVDAIRNYHLTFSHAESNGGDVMSALHQNMNVAVVFNVKKKDALPKEWRGIEVVDGDESDLRFLDPKGKIIGLKAKGKAKKDETGFVIKLKAA